MLTTTPTFSLYGEDTFEENLEMNESLSPLESLASPASKMPYQPVQTSIHITSAVRFATDELGTAAMYPDNHRYGCIMRMLRNPNVQIAISVAAGVGVGFLMTRNDVSVDVNELVGLPGQIFLRLLRLLVVPMVFASLTTGIATIVQLGKTSAIGVRMAIWFMIMSTVCATLSLAVALAWRSVHPEQMFQPRQRPQLLLSLTCTNGKFVEMVSETITCSADVESASTRFELIDITKAIVRGRRPSKRGLSDQITNIIFSLVPSNIMESFQQGAVMAVITFSLSFGAAAIANDEHDSPLLLVLAHMSNAFFYIITRVIDWSPIGVFSLMASSFVSLGPPDDAGMGAGPKRQGFSDDRRGWRDRVRDHSWTVLNAQSIAGLMLCSLVCVLLVQLVIYPILLWFTTRRRPFKYMWQMLPCATFAFGCASSLVTLPVTLRCVESTREVSRALLHFVLTVGSIVHKNGTAMLFPNAVVFLAATASSEIKIGIAQMVIIIVVSVLASIGAAPIPNSGLFMVFSVWASAFPNDNVPTTFSYLVAIYWYIDRMSTLCNVLGDTYVARIIAEHVDETFERSEG